jgi:hypothetical protein
MKRAGFNDSFVGNVAGHSDPRTTKRYTHFSVEETRMTLQALSCKGFINRHVMKGDKNE